MKRLYRSRQLRVLGGVAAGTAEYFGIDITLMRLLFILAGLVMPQVIVAYILAWVIIPEEPAVASEPYRTTTQSAGQRTSQGTTQTADSYAPVSEPLPPTADEILGQSGTAPVTSVPSVSPGTTNTEDRESDKGKQFFGYLLIGIGVIALLRSFVPRYVWRMPFELLRSWWPLAIIALGFALIFGALKGR